MKILLFGIRILIFFVNIMTFWIPVKEKRVLLISNFSNELTDNYKCIYDELKKDSSYEIVLLLHKYEKNILGEIKYLIFCMKQAFYINTSQVVIIDTFCITLNYIVQKKKTKVIQIWHASGAYKKFGHDVQGRTYDLKPVDYVLTTSKNINSIYAKALNVKLENVIPLGNPRTDNLFDDEWVKNKNKLLREKYNIKKDEIVVTYAPTLDNGRNIEKDVFLDINKLHNQFGDKFKIAIKQHTRMNNNIKSKEVINFFNEKITDVLTVTDVLITDYSSIIFEFLIIKNKLILYVNDLDDYIKNIGIYMSEKELSNIGLITKNYEELENALNNINNYSIENSWVKDYNFEYHDGKSTHRLITLIKDICENKEKKRYKNEKLH